MIYIQVKSLARRHADEEYLKLPVSFALVGFGRFAEHGAGSLADVLEEFSLHEKLVATLLQVFAFPPFNPLLNLGHFEDGRFPISDMRLKSQGVFPVLALLRHLVARADADEARVERRQDSLHLTQSLAIFIVVSQFHERLQDVKVVEEVVDRAEEQFR